MQVKLHHAKKKPHVNIIQKQWLLLCIIKLKKTTNTTQDSENPISEKEWDKIPLPKVQQLFSSVPRCLQTVVKRRRDATQWETWCVRTTKPNEQPLFPVSWHTLLCSYVFTDTFTHWLSCNRERHQLFPHNLGRNLRIEAQRTDKLTRPLGIEIKACVWWRYDENTPNGTSALIPEKEPVLCDPLMVVWLFPLLSPAARMQHTFLTLLIL